MTTKQMCTPESIKKKKETYKRIGHQQGSKNSQFGKPRSEETKRKIALALTKPENLNKVKKQPNLKKTNEEVFVRDSLYSHTHLKKRVLNDKLLTYECQVCKLGPIWNDQPLVLHLDHINGDSLDHRLENLRFLCPNCHTQQETYSRGQKFKNKKQRRQEIKLKNEDNTNQGSQST